MVFQKNRINKIIKKNDTGFGNNASNHGGRLLNKDGTPNVIRTGIGFREKVSWFHAMLTMKWGKFFMFVLFFYIAVNLLFAIIYLAIGIEKLAGIQANTFLQKIYEAFFFSTQTFTTVGYGRVSPTGFAMNAVSSLQALIGLLSFAVATGLMYGRFSLPKAYLKFSSRALISPYDDITALMIRVAPFKQNTSLTDVEAKLTISMVVEENGKLINDFFTLKLELDKLNALPLSWTIVHPITEDSPIYHYSKKDFFDAKVEIMLFIKAFDETFSNNVIARSSYTFNELDYGKKFVPMYKRDISGSTTIIHLDKLNDTVNAEMPIIQIKKND